jgi:hypothetical protein
LRLEHFGNAMHVVEDFYAHSNFVELAVLDLGGARTPMAGWYAGTRDPVRDVRGRIRLTTGVFLARDTVVSLEKLLIGSLEGHPPMPGDPKMASALRRVLVRRLLGDTALTLYDRAMAGWEATGIPALGRRLVDLTGAPAARQLLEQQIERPLRALSAGCCARSRRRRPASRSPSRRSSASTEPAAGHRGLASRSLRRPPRPYHPLPGCWPCRPSATSGRPASGCGRAVRRPTTALCCSSTPRTR